MTLIWESVASAPHRMRSYSSCCSAAASTALIWEASEPWMASSTTCTRSWAVLPASSCRMPAVTRP